MLTSQHDACIIICQLVDTYMYMYNVHQRYAQEIMSGFKLTRGIACGTRVLLLICSNCKYTRASKRPIQLS